MTELKLQTKFIAVLKKHGILAYKFTSPGNAGVPDLICIAPHGAVFFIELKHPNGRGRLSALQKSVIAKITARGAKVYVTDNAEDLPHIIREQS